ncbi:MAG: bifunctional phosphoribosylaminoimidazolecarboxamide formyltransferase/inosine monophosphate cyclohydrolase [Verrucomicrobia bacterium]|nr:MAG: bifunctional phosphoribosylaminoimidazolecarboxamide formyltransferase/inosine monophosphate cyclohydrolase [Verrucomicrobiota bacterium]PYL20155.1 MAG: bifunctional phosphoribosylaminoimidazolecarboxamide formyltransferase/inosine monophosphate cyclohydrolase [Verrucomicrobiota bacterium]PYL80166.1 MAG: bifunctional phosphoribosylaminoimidazolecarboxamide formyltransferase/inosine monophosphate cyclohydrolase [Verrucomicrobiota bacterium]
MKISRALISVSDKSVIASFARALERQGVDIISTGGTAELLRREKIPVREISSFTAFPEVLEGRVKTLHPRVHGGLLYKRGNPKHEAEARECGFEPIDLVVVNLYPFEETIGKPDVTLAQAIENIDIGGPSMIRSAAKNYESVTVVVDPADYDTVLENMRENNGETTLKLRERLAIKAFIKTSEYDRVISNFLEKEQATDASFSLSLPLVTRLRYGENPHQKAALYGDFDKHFEKLHGKELSFNNILDISAATNLIGEFDDPTVAILKHTNPCGVGSDADLRKAWDKAFATDKQAPFGGIIICNRPLGEPLAKAISEIFSEVIIAPDFDAEARGILQKKKNLRLVRLLTAATEARPTRDIRSVCGGVLVQDADSANAIRENVVTKRQPTKTELKAMLFGSRVVKHVKSNAIVYASADRTLGIGAGQMSRIDASRIAIWKAEEAGLSLKASAVASDAFFPFPDALIAAANAGATCAIQPGGSIRDEEVIAAANERNMAMIFTRVRHFRH